MCYKFASNFTTHSATSYTAHFPGKSTAVSVHNSEVRDFSGEYEVHISVFRVHYINHSNCHPDSKFPSEADKEFADSLNVKFL